MFIKITIIQSIQQGRPLEANYPTNYGNVDHPAAIQDISTNQRARIVGSIRFVGDISSQWLLCPNLDTNEKG